MKTALARSAFLSGALALTLAPIAAAVSPANQTAVTNGAAYLKTQQAADGHIGASAGETGWSAVALAAAGNDLSTVSTSGGTSLRAYLQANAPAAAAPATDWERSIIAITADGQNPYSFGGTDYVTKLKSLASAGQIGSVTAVNDDIFGLIALLASRVPPSDELVTAEVNYILSQQRSDGGFSYTTDSATGSDTNDTAAAIMALRAAQDAGLGSGDVTGALADAQDYLLGTQNDGGGFPYDPLSPYGTASDVSSTAWALMALNALGDENTSAGDDAQAYIRAAQNSDGSFPYMAPAAGDVFDTAPAVTALAGGQYPLSVYDGPLPGAGEGEQNAEPTPTVTPTPSASPVADRVDSGQVLGAATTPTPSPTPTPTTAASTSEGDVLGASTLPVVGEVSNLALLELAVAIATMAGLAAYGIQRTRAKRQTLN